MAERGSRVHCLLLLTGVPSCARSTTYPQFECDRMRRCDLCAQCWILGISGVPSLTSIVVIHAYCMQGLWSPAKVVAVYRPSFPPIRC